MLTRSQPTGRSDPLTGLPDRAELERRIAAAAGPLLLLVLDVEESSSIGTIHGRQVGDDVLRRLARRVRAARPAGDVVARVGDHRLAVLVGDPAGPPPERIAGRLIAVVEEPVRSGRNQFSAGCSVGIAASGPDLATGEELVTAAEQAVAAARRAGRGGCVVFDQALRAHVLSQSALEHDLREAVRFGWVDVGYAPVRTLGADPTADRVETVVATPRWTLGDGTDVPPARFLPLADDLGIGAKLGMHLLQAALDALAAWRSGGCGLRLAVPAGPALLEDPELAHRAGALLAERDLPPGCLSVRVGAAGLRESDSCLSGLGMLRSLGIGVVLVDFGRTGTSLTGLRRLPLTGVELDAALAGDLGSEQSGSGGADPQADAVPRAALAMCRGLGLSATVAGVTVTARLEAARLLGADAATGRLVGAAVAAQSVPGLSCALAPAPLTVVGWDA